MSFSSSERATLERALLAIEEVLARTTCGTPSGIRQGTAAHDALKAGLTAAAALVDVSHTLLRTSHHPSQTVLSKEWGTVVTHAELASRQAQRMARVLAAEPHIAMAQGPLKRARPGLPATAPAAQAVEPGSRRAA